MTVSQPHPNRPKGLSLLPPKKERTAGVTDFLVREMELRGVYKKKYAREILNELLQVGQPCLLTDLRQLTGLPREAFIPVLVWMKEMKLVQFERSAGDTKDAIVRFTTKGSEIAPVVKEICLIEEIK